MVVRFGGDEFTILVDGLHDEGESLLVAQRILGQMETPATIDGLAVKIVASIGVAPVRQTISRSKTCCATPIARCTASRRPAEAVAFCSPRRRLPASSGLDSSPQQVSSLHEDRPGADVTSDNAGAAGRVQQPLFSYADETVRGEFGVRRAGRRGAGGSPGDRRAMRALSTTPAEAPRAGQISGAEPTIMAAAARIVERTGLRHRRSQFRVPHATAFGSRRGRGTAGRPAGHRANRRGRCPRRIHPRHLKIRSGPDADARDGVGSRPPCQRSPARRPLAFMPEAWPKATSASPDWAVVTRVKQAVEIPMIGSGGIRRPPTPFASFAKRCRRRGDRPRMSRQSVDFRAGPRALVAGGGELAPFAAPAGSRDVATGGR